MLSNDISHEMSARVTKASLAWATMAFMVAGDKTMAETAASYQVTPSVSTCLREGAI